MKTHASFKLSLCALLLAGLATGARASSPFMIDIDFTGTDFPSGKTGTAAIGVGSTDYWNWYTRNDGHGGWLNSGSLTDMKLIDETATTVDLAVNNFPGAWGNGSPDSMYDGYIYPFSGIGTMTLSQLPLGLYDVYAYSVDSNYELSVGSVSYGVKTSYDYPVMNPLVWTEGVQYTRYSGVSVGLGDAITLTVRPGLDGTAMISGLQLVAVPEPASGALLGLGMAAMAIRRWRRAR
jgi:hypothetical protein